MATTLSAVFVLGATEARACEPRDFLALPVPAAGTEVDALALSYPGLRVAPDGDAVSIDSEAWLPLGERQADPARRLVAATIRDSFAVAYPLRFDFEARRAPEADPGRARSSDLLGALYGSTEAQVRARVVRVVEPRLAGVAFTVTAAQGVDCQLAAALDAIAADAATVAPFFQDAAGGFLWRRVAGTERLSAHAYGIAIDLNADLGGYWRWTGAAEGRVGAYHNRIPEALVREMERRGFIWGGKWHHFDGMHFEYRPEIILHARMNAN
ncbi:M15 family metallopeptidase [Roseovarius sp. M141]|uniref:M15 family metallopeptidase n=1 Tax=Roseovarius sp. M141 TaxID=2583806 RepID=UPI0020CEC290|nr:M15 family metallopeptidase [Roseovarius sp. M141]MCQ0091385.1 M15 family metallopeptidase [Roseovarius sp. M141]